MKWTKYETVFDKIRKNSRKHSDWTDEEIIESLKRLSPDVREVFAQEVHTEYTWIRNQKPYYRVYPSIEPLLMRSDLSFPGKLLRFPVSVCTMEISDRSETNLTHAMFWEAIFGEHRYLTVNVGYTLQGKPQRTAIEIRLDDDEIGDDLDRQLNLPRQHWDVNSGFSDVEPSAAVNDSITCAIRYVIGACMLADDPMLIEPIVLNRDIPKYKDADEATKKVMEDRAARLKGRGWAIGKGFEERCEQSPHFRKSHLALFWTGKGRTVPQLKLRKGCLVKPRSITQMPTGYYGKET